MPAFINVSSCPDSRHQIRALQGMLALGMIVLALGGRAAADITGTSGAIVVSTAPADVSSNHWESDTQIRVFPEQQSLELSQELPLDISQPGTSPGPTDSNLSPGTIAAGATVNAYALHFDVVGTRATNNPLEAIGSVTFDTEILALIVQSDTLNTTNGVLGLSGVTYSSGPDHGLELNPAGGGTSDVITLSPDRRTITVDLHNASFADDARIITTTPEPGGGMLLMVSTAIALWRRVPRQTTGD